MLHAARPCDSCRQIDHIPASPELIVSFPVVWARLREAVIGILSGNLNRKIPPDAWERLHYDVWCLLTHNLADVSHMFLDCEMATSAKLILPTPLAAGSQLPSWVTIHCALFSTASVLTDTIAARFTDLPGPYSTLPIAFPPSALPLSPLCQSQIALAVHKAASLLARYASEWTVFAAGAATVHRLFHLLNEHELRPLSASDATAAILFPSVQHLLLRAWARACLSVGEPPAFPQLQPQSGNNAPPTQSQHIPLGAALVRSVCVLLAARRARSRIAPETATLLHQCTSDLTAVAGIGSVAPAVDPFGVGEAGIKLIDMSDDAAQRVLQIVATILASAQAMAACEPDVFVAPRKSGMAQRSGAPLRSTVRDVTAPVAPGPAGGQATGVAVDLDGSVGSGRAVTGGHTGPHQSDPANGISISDASSLRSPPFASAQLPDIRGPVPVTTLAPAQLFMAAVRRELLRGSFGAAVGAMTAPLDAETAVPEWESVGLTSLGLQAAGTCTPDAVGLVGMSVPLQPLSISALKGTYVDGMNRSIHQVPVQLRGAAAVVARARSSLLEEFGTLNALEVDEYQAAAAEELAAHAVQAVPAVNFAALDALAAADAALYGETLSVISQSPASFFTHNCWLSQYVAALVAAAAPVAAQSSARGDAGAALTGSGGKARLLPPDALFSVCAGSAVDPDAISAAAAQALASGPAGWERGLFPDDIPQLERSGWLWRVAGGLNAKDEAQGFGVRTELLRNLHVASGFVSCRGGPLSAAACAAGIAAVIRCGGGSSSSVASELVPRWVIVTQMLRALVSAAHMIADSSTAVCARAAVAPPEGSGSQPAASDSTVGMQEGGPAQGGWSSTLSAFPPRPQPSTDPMHLWPDWSTVPPELLPLRHALALGLRRAVTAIGADVVADAIASVIHAALCAAAAGPPLADLSESLASASGSCPAEYGNGNVLADGTASSTPPLVPPGDTLTAESDPLTPSQHLAQFVANSSLREAVCPATLRDMRYIARDVAISCNSSQSRTASPIEASSQYSSVFDQNIYPLVEVAIAAVRDDIAAAPTFTVCKALPAAVRLILSAPDLVAIVLQAAGETFSQRLTLDAARRAVAGMFVPRAESLLATHLRALSRAVRSLASRSGAASFITWKGEKHAIAFSHAMGAYARVMRSSSPATAFADLIRGGNASSSAVGSKITIGPKSDAPVGSVSGKPASTRLPDGICTNCSGCVYIDLSHDSVTGLLPPRVSEALDQLLSLTSRSTWAVGPPASMVIPPYGVSAAGAVARMLAARKAAASVSEVTDLSGQAAAAASSSASPDPSDASPLIPLVDKAPPQPTTSARMPTADAASSAAMARTAGRLLLQGPRDLAVWRAAIGTQQLRVAQAHASAGTTGSGASARPRGGRGIGAPAAPADVSVALVYKPSWPLGSGRSGGAPQTIHLDTEAAYKLLPEPVGSRASVGRRFAWSLPHARSEVVITEDWLSPRRREINGGTANCISRDTASGGGCVTVVLNGPSTVALEAFGLAIEGSSTSVSDGVSSANGSDDRLLAYVSVLDSADAGTTQAGGPKSPDLAQGGAGPLAYVVPLGLIIRALVGRDTHSSAMTSSTPQADGDVTMAHGNNAATASAAHSSGAVLNEHRSALSASSSPAATDLLPFLLPLFTSGLLGLHVLTRNQAAALRRFPAGSALQNSAGASVSTEDLVTLPPRMRGPALVTPLLDLLEASVSEEASATAARRRTPLEQVLHTAAIAYDTFVLNHMERSSATEGARMQEGDHTTSLRSETVSAVPNSRDTAVDDLHSVFVSLSPLLPASITSSAVPIASLEAVVAATGKQTMGLVVPMLSRSGIEPLDADAVRAQLQVPPPMKLRLSWRHAQASMCDLSGSALARPPPKVSVSAVPPRQLALAAAVRFVKHATGPTSIAVLKERVTAETDLAEDVVDLAIQDGLSKEPPLLVRDTEHPDAVRYVVE